MSMYFTAVGELGFNDIGAKVPWFRSGTSKNGQEYESINISVIAAKNNRIFSSAFGIKSTEIKTRDTGDNNISISWEDRFDKNVVDSVSFFSKYVANVTGDDRKEFITGWDFVEYLKDNKEILSGNKYIVRGQVKPNIYKGKISQSFEIQSVIKADEDAKNKIEISMDYFYTADSIDVADFAKEKKVYINGYTSEYISELKKNQYMPLQVLFNCSRLDEENEKHMNRRNFNFKLMGIDCVDNKPSIKLKKKKVYKLGILCSYVNGAEEVPFDESALTDAQKMAIELGVNTLDDFKPKGQIYGNRVVSYNIKQVNLSKYPDGYEDTEMTTSEFEDDIYNISNEETTDVIEKAAEKEESSKKETPVEDDDPDLEDLFS